jgi:hypothetical protein
MEIFELAQEGLKAIDPPDLFSSEEQAESACHRQLEPLSNPASQEIVENHECVRRLESQSENFPLSGAKVRDERQYSPSRHAPYPDPRESIQVRKSNSSGTPHGDLPYHGLRNENLSVEGWQEIQEV